MACYLESPSYRFLETLVKKMRTLIGLIGISYCRLLSCSGLLGALWLIACHYDISQDVSRHIMNISNAIPPT